jgi:hypothetical protein
MFDAMGPTATWEYVGKISPAIPTLRKLVDHMENTINHYRRYKKHTVRGTEDDVAKLMALFQGSTIYTRTGGRKVELKERFVDIWARGFGVVSKGESLTRWFKNRKELLLVRENGVAEDYEDLMLSDED